MAAFKAPQVVIASARSRYIVRSPTSTRISVPQRDTVTSSPYSKPSPEKSLLKGTLE